MLHLKEVIKDIKIFFIEHWEQIKIPLYGLFAFLDVDIDIVNILMWLMIIDTATGIIKTITVDKLTFEFKLLYHGIMSKFVLLLIPMTLALMALGIGYNFTWAVDGVLRLIILSEGISIFTNALSIKDNRAIKNKDYLSLILHWVRDKLMKTFEENLKK